MVNSRPYCKGGDIFYPFSFQYGRTELCPCLFLTTRLHGGMSLSNLFWDEAVFSLLARGVLVTGSVRGLAVLIQSEEDGILAFGPIPDYSE